MGMTSHEDDVAELELYVHNKLFGPPLKSSTEEKVGHHHHPSAAMLKCKKILLFAQSEFLNLQHVVLFYNHFYASAIWYSTK